MRLMNSTIGISGVAILFAVASQPAEARIQCKGIYQVSKYGLISTPYCQEQQIAVVAQTYGVRVTPSQVRNDPMTKVKLCFRFGNDVRLKGACGAYSPDHYR